MRAHRGHPVCVLLMLSACTSGPEQVLADFSAPAGDYQLRVTLGAARWPQTMDTLKVYLVPRGDSAGTRIATTEVATAGASFGPDQLSLKWATERTLLLCLKPTAAAPHGLRIDLSGPVSVATIAHC